MVRVNIKGGIWKNSEDEILKAAVQKYGKQQWARVASLLNRKTAKQAKARWHEWLDPSIRKTTEWSREEEEKLLHLAKLLPAQWKTIGPLVGGRTATQCQEHYEYLLDQAAGGGEGGADAAGGSSDLRKHGDAIAHPETKPARPDAVDMDEDEQEMLQEARARLANTQGKKAKRKAREKMLAQAKRLADLQKRRELKQAGLLSQKAATKARKRNRDIDLGVEIPFHKPAPAGLHDTSSEAARAEDVRRKRWKSIDYNQINEQQYKTRDREAAAMRKKEEARMRILQDSNEKYAAAAKNEEEDRPARPRVSLKLPEPSITDKERQEWSKQVQQQQQGLDQDHGEGVTAALMGDYTDRALPTPLRSAAQPKRMDLTATATQLRRLQETQTPLLHSTAADGGGFDDEMQDGDMNKDDNDAKPAATVGNATPLIPSRRDELGLNAADSDARSVATFATTATDLRSLARHERRAAKRARQELTEALNALPLPQFEYELAAPNEVSQDEDDTTNQRTGLVRDRADVEADIEKSKQEKIKKELEKRSTVLKRKDLPRPPLPSKEKSDLLPLLVAGASNQEFEQMVQEETLALLAHDGMKYPPETKLKKSKASKKKAPPASLQEIPESYLDEARSALTSEVAKSANEASRDWSTGGDSMLYLPDVGWSQDPSSVSNENQVKSLELEYETLKSALFDLRAKNDKTSKKLNVVNGGYSKRSKSLHQELLDTSGQIRNAEIELDVFARLMQQEKEGGLRRTEELRRQIESLKEQEARLQKEYGLLAVEKRRIMVMK